MSEFILIDGILLFLITVTSLAVVMMRNLLAAIVAMAVYSFLMSLVWLNLDAVDVAFTEAAVGVGISTILLIGALVLVGTDEKKHRAIHWPAFLITALTAAALIYGTLDMPHFGDSKSPPQTHVVPEYILQTVEKNKPASKDGHGARHENYFHGHVDNLVTSVIVNYRAYDTLFEVAVIFTAGISLILLLRSIQSGRREELP